MPNPLIVDTSALDSSIIRRHLDQRNVSLVVFDCNDPHRLLDLKAYASAGYLQTKRFIRHRVICTPLDEQTPETEHHIDDIRLYHGL